MKLEIEKFLKENDVDVSDIKLVLASAGAFYDLRIRTLKFEEDNGNNYMDRSFTNELFSSMNNICEALGYDVLDFID